MNFSLIFCLEKTTNEEEARLIHQFEMLRRELKDTEEKAQSAHKALCDAEKAHKDACEKAFAANHCLKVAQGGGLVYHEGHPRPYFIPAQIDDQLARSQRSCVKACLAKLGSVIVLTDGPQHVMWPEILQNVCPEGIELYSFTDATDLKVRVGDNLDRLYVAVVNKVVGISNHAMLLWKEENVRLDQFKLFSPGEYKSERIIDIGKGRDVANWSGICVAFIPGTGVLNKDSLVIDLRL
jgi:hypothetical protein